MAEDEEDDDRFDGLDNLSSPSIPLLHSPTYPQANVSTTPCLCNPSTSKLRPSSRCIKRSGPEAVVCRSQHPTADRYRLVLFPTLGCALYPMYPRPSHPARRRLRNACKRYKCPIRHSAGIPASRGCWSSAPLAAERVPLATNL